MYSAAVTMAYTVMASAGLLHVLGGGTPTGEARKVPDVTPVVEWPSDSKCPLCDAAAPTRTHLSHHLRFVCAADRSRCPHCGGELEPEELCHHLLHGCGLRPLHCPECTQSWRADDIDSAVHVLAHIVQQVHRRNCTRCRFCGAALISGPALLSAHADAASVLTPGCDCEDLARRMLHRLSRYHLEQHTRRTKTRKSLLRILNGLLSRAFGSWVDELRRRQALPLRMAQMRRIRAQWDRRLMAEGVLEWRERLCMARRLQRAVIWWVDRAKAKALSTWQATRLRRHELRSIHGLIFLTRCRTLTRSVWNALVGFLESQREALNNALEMLR